MNLFANAVAIVTGGASGIGRAVAGELVRSGGHVVLADIEGEAARTEANALTANGGKASGAAVDVTDAAAVQQLIDHTVAQYGRLDYLFNNAGIATFGEVRDMTLTDWNRIIDVNLRGVVHGIAAAYPLMIRQGFGHLVNTASLAGLVPSPGATAYAATKHAIVGLSTSLRVEAAGLGVKVSAVCPGFIDTPITQHLQLLKLDRDTVLRNFPFKLHPVDACARAIVQGVARNQAIITVTAMAKVSWRLYRLAPALMLRASQAGAKRNPLLRRPD